MPLSGIYHSNLLSFGYYQALILKIHIGITNAAHRFGKVKDVRLYDKRSPEKTDGSTVGAQGHVVLEAETELRNNVPAFLRDRQ